MESTIEPVATPHGTWCSGLSVASFAACLDLGMEPVGVTKGIAVMQWAWYANTYGRPPLPGPTGRRQYSESWQCPHGFVSAEHRLYGFNYEQTWVEGNWANGFGLAYGRMLEEATALGAHGIIGVVDDMHQLAGAGTAEFSIRGTAVRVPGSGAAHDPFRHVPLRAAPDQVDRGGLRPGRHRRGVELGADDRLLHDPLPAGRHERHGFRADPACSRSPRSRGPRRQRGGWSASTSEPRSARTRSTALSFEQFDHELGEADLAVQCVMKGTRVRRVGAFSSLPQPELVVPLA